MLGFSSMNQSGQLIKLFKMVLKVRKETPVPPKAEAKANTLKAKRTVLKGVFSHAKKDPHLTYLLTAQDTAA
ncbi:hypothetical protein J1605_017941 [Eschrichtius robustus]|uniref:Uncharacterized protein n=1 Tax=Eschrichtius robustus TaxID=9764 RepID=A0AB34HZR5_ESCRO|nr:hypothetical protein J1605_017941 [Eschrichtius robustus]